jgi:hypothetical protein
MDFGLQLRLLKARWPHMEQESTFAVCMTFWRKKKVMGKPLAPSPDQEILRRPDGGSPGPCALEGRRKVVDLRQAQAR